jgi:CheY-like chemotaxis protein
MKRRVVAAVDDLFFAAKIRTTAELLGVPISFARDPDALIAAAQQDLPALVVVDLQAQRLDPFALAERMKTDAGLSHVPLIGFCSHVQTELLQRARQSGFDRVMARSTFTKELPEILQSAGTSASE